MAQYGDWKYPNVKPKRKSVTHHDNQQSVGHDEGEFNALEDHADEEDGYDDESGGDKYY
jgi:hypothetical protein